MKWVNGKGGIGKEDRITWDDPMLLSVKMTDSGGMELIIMDKERNFHLCPHARIAISASDSITIASCLFEALEKMNYKEFKERKP